MVWCPVSYVPFTVRDATNRAARFGHTIMVVGLLVYIVISVDLVVFVSKATASVQSTLFSIF